MWSSVSKLKCKKNEGWKHFLKFRCRKIACAVAKHYMLALFKVEMLKNCTPLCLFFWLVAAWVKSRAERPSVSVVNRQLHVQMGCKLGIRNRKDELEASKAKQITN